MRPPHKLSDNQIILVSFQQDVQQKLRPGLVLRMFPKYNDLLICGISAQLHQYLSGFDLILDPTDPDFPATGLKKAGVCRINMLMMLPLHYVTGSIGSVSPIVHQTLFRTFVPWEIKLQMGS